MRQLLHRDITPMLETANNALSSRPPYISVARERISRVLMLIADECAKLDREDAADRERR